MDQDHTQGTRRVDSTGVERGKISSTKMAFTRRFPAFLCDVFMLDTILQLVRRINWPGESK